MPIQEVVFELTDNPGVEIQFKRHQIQIEKRNTVGEVQYWVYLPWLQTGNHHPTLVLSQNEIEDLVSQLAKLSKKTV